MTSSKRDVLCALDGAWAADSSIKKAPRVFKDRTPESQALRSLQDNFRNISVETAHSLVRNGQTLWDRLLTDKRMAQQNRQDYTFGCQYYRKLRQLYLPDDDPSQQLPKGLPVTPSLLSVYVDCFKHPPLRQGFRDACGAMTDLPKGNFVCMAQVFLHLQPAVSEDTLETMLCIVRAWQRLKANELHKDIFEYVVPHCDRLVLHARTLVAIELGLGRRGGVLLAFAVGPWILQPCVFLRFSLSRFRRKYVKNRCSEMRS